jgi:hypothetical protein
MILSTSVVSQKQLKYKSIYCRFKGAWGSLFSPATQKTPEPVTDPIVSNVQRTGTKNASRCGDIVRGAAS